MTAGPAVAHVLAGTAGIVRMTATGVQAPPRTVPGDDDQESDRSRPARLIPTITTIMPIVNSSQKDPRSTCATRLVAEMKDRTQYPMLVAAPRTAATMGWMVGSLRRDLIRGG
ncbi:hypothetical protein [uncultured Amnibacterium sp.]|uniref:hypothetical protein n=1 Tax=uncultured Amnibacterium sp. TaxID=1631851 RepID=UPI0035C97198